jgi:transposase-like protein
LKQELSQVLENGIGGAEHPLDRFLKVASTYLLQEALEAEVSEFLGRAHYRRGARKTAGWRNGYEPKRVRTTHGLLRLSQPQVRATSVPFSSRLAKALRRRSPQLEQLVTRMWVRGLSCRDVQDLWVEALGERVLSKSAVSSLSQHLAIDFDRWRKRDLSDLPLVYLFLDAIYLRVRQGSREQEGILCAYGVTTTGQKVLLHLALGCRESYDAWLAFLQDLVARDLAAPLLVISDGLAALRRAIGEVFPHAYRQRCQVHRMRNILAKLPRGVRAEMKRLIHHAYHAPDYATGLRRGRALIARFQARYPAAMETLQEDLEACLVYLKFPPEHHRSLRSTNLLERLFGEGRRRTKVIPRFPTERSCLQLVQATLLAASQTWHKLRMSPSIQKRLNTLRTAALPHPSTHAAA